jgi:hypothetical protein
MPSENIFFLIQKNMTPQRFPSRHSIKSDAFLSVFSVLERNNSHRGRDRDCKVDVVFRIHH